MRKLRNDALLQQRRHVVGRVIAETHRDGGPVPTPGAEIVLREIHVRVVHTIVTLFAAQIGHRMGLNRAFAELGIVQVAREPDVGGSLFVHTVQLTGGDATVTPIKKTPLIVWLRGVVVVVRLVAEPVVHGTPETIFGLAGVVQHEP